MIVVQLRLLWLSCQPRLVSSKSLLYFRANVNVLCLLVSSFHCLYHSSCGWAWVDRGSERRKGIKEFIVCVNNPRWKPECNCKTDVMPLQLLHWLANPAPPTCTHFHQPLHLYCPLLPPPPLYLSDPWLMLPAHLPHQSPLLFYHIPTAQKC